jgi:hypothetical protein
LPIATFGPACASETTSCTPARPRLTSKRRKLRESQPQIRVAARLPPTAHFPGARCSRGGGRSFIPRQRLGLRAQPSRPAAARAAPNPTPHDQALSPRTSGKVERFH